MPLIVVQWRPPVCRQKARHFANYTRIWPPRHPSRPRLRHDYVRARARGSAAPGRPTGGGAPAPHTHHRAASLVRRPRHRRRRHHRGLPRARRDCPFTPTPRLIGVPGRDGSVSPPCSTMLTVVPHVPLLHCALHLYRPPALLSACTTSRVGQAPAGQVSPPLPDPPPPDLRWLPLPSLIINVYVVANSAPSLPFAAT